MAVSRMRNNKICYLTLTCGRIAKMVAPFRDGLVNSAMRQIPCLGSYVGDIMYADDTVLIAVVVDEAKHINMTFNASKSAVIRIGKYYKHPCAPLQLAGVLLRCNVRAKYTERSAAFDTIDRNIVITHLSSQVRSLLVQFLQDE